MTPQDNINIIIADWICCAFTVIVIMARVILRFARKRPAYRDDYVVPASMILILTRGAAMHYTLIWGSNNVSHPEKLSAEDIKKRQIGSQLTLTSRVLYLMFVWMMKYCMIIFYERLTARQSGYAKVLLGMKITLVLTFIGVVLSTFLECRPITHYWQVNPYPGVPCTQSQGQLLTMGITNLTTDIALIIIPLPLIFRTQLPLSRKLQLAGLFSVGFFVVAVTIMKMPIIVKDANVIRERALWASIEMLACCIVVNFPILLNYYRSRNRDSRNISMQATRGTNIVDRSDGSRSAVPCSPRRFAHGSRTGTSGTGSIDEFCYESVYVPVGGKVRIETTQEISQMVNRQNNAGVHDEEKGYTTRSLQARRDNVINTEIWTDQRSGNSVKSADLNDGGVASTTSLNGEKS